jgi:hypothetical protein
MLPLQRSPAHNSHAVSLAFGLAEGNFQETPSQFKLKSLANPRPRLCAYIEVIPISVAEVDSVEKR